MFGLRRAGHDDFQMGVAFPQESASVSGAHDSLVREGLVHLRARLDQGTEEDGSLIEIPSNVFGRLATEFPDLGQAADATRITKPGGTAARWSPVPFFVAGLGRPRDWGR